MPQPTKQHLQLVGGANSENSTLYTSDLIQTGDVLKISGTGSNDGVFTVTDVVNTLNSSDAAGTTFTDNTCDTTNTSTSITHNANAQIIAGLSVSGTGIPSGSYIVSITNSTTFVLSKAATANGTNVTLTFGDMDVYFVLKGRGIVDDSSGGDPEIQVITGEIGDKMIALGDVDSQGNVDVWSSNATTDYTSKNNGWETSAISPTIKGDNAKYIYHMADDTVRVCNTNSQNTSIIKWYGYIQKNQFNATTGLVFAEWQEHPNSLASPKVATSFSYAFGTSSHDGTSSGNYYLNPTTHDFRGVVVQKYAANEPLQMGLNITASTTSFSFENSSGDDKTGRAIVGEVISINDVSGNVGDLGEYPKEFMFCKQAYHEGTGKAIYQRSYGGNLGGTAPFDFADNDTPILERGTGWNIGISNGTDEGSWESVTYEFYETFIYDGNQESLPIQIGDGAASIGAFTHTATGGKSLRISIYADLAYSGRITGGRIYTRVQNTDDDLIMLADIDIVKGVRTSLDGDHKAWTYQSGYGYYVAGNATGNSISPNLDTYTTINGFSPDIKFLGIGGINEGYRSSVVANRRTFIANVKIKSDSGELKKFGDRIMYSEIGKFDTFLPHNFIDVSKGDYGEYTALESFADRLLAFKHNLVHVINIASPSIANWYLEDTFKYYGVRYPYSVAKTNKGVAWVSDDGCYFYDGRSVRNLIDRKIAVSEPSFGSVNWNNWYRGSSTKKDAMLGYDPITNSLIMMRSPNDASNNSNQAFIYDFDSGGWTYNTNLFTDSSYYTNFVTDMNNNLSVGVFDGSTDVEFKKFLPIQSSQSNQEFYTKDIDFGVPQLTKKIYKVIVTYKSDGAETTPFSYAIDGKQDFSGSGGGTLTGNFITASRWDVATLTPSSPVSCQSIQIKFSSPSAGKFEINDMSIQYRVIGAKEVS
jgi:hypothetical protein